jgi:DNA replication and repair protein RecF
MPTTAPRLWVKRLALTSFRNYARVDIRCGPAPVVLTGMNGAGKTNLLEAVSLLVPGNGIRRAPLDEIARKGGDGSWAVAAEVEIRSGPLAIGTGLAPASQRTRAGRIVRVDGETTTTGKLADHVEMVWLTPAMDQLLAGPASERRRFLDRLILCFDSSYSRQISRFERATQQRNRLLADGGDRVLLDALEIQMAEAGTALAAARVEAVAALSGAIKARRQAEPNASFPWAGIALVGTLEEALMATAAVDVEDEYRARLARERERDRGAGRALVGPHRSDFIVTHGPKDMPARLSSTGEQKALLMGLVLSHAQLIAQRRGEAPIVLLDEVAAHFDVRRRAALFEEILALGVQAWLTGTEADDFSGLAGKALVMAVEDGQMRVVTQPS